MGKRSSFTRRPQDAYDTPLNPVRFLVPHLQARFSYAELCAGQHDLIDHLALLRPEAECVIATDIKPRDERVFRTDILEATIQEIEALGVDYIITNPPWTRELLHAIIMLFCQARPTWLLFDSDWAYTDQALPYLRYCRKIVAIGRVKWIENSSHSGKDNASWYLFDAKTIGPTRFFGRDGSVLR